MPIYEYYCQPCHRVFQFWSQSAASTREPVCPKCGARELKKLLSKFSVTGAVRKSKGAKAQEPAAAGAPGAAAGPEAADPLEDPRLEAEMTQLMADADGIDENDPRQLGRLMRRMTALTGEKLDKNMETALRRLEAGEDPDKIEEDMGDVLGGDDRDGGPGVPPSYDDQLYPM